MMKCRNGEGPYKKKAFERQSRSRTHSVLEQSSKKLGIAAPGGAHF